MILQPLLEDVNFTPLSLNFHELLIETITVTWVNNVASSANKLINKSIKILMNMTQCKAHSTSSSGHWKPENEFFVIMCPQRCIQHSLENQMFCR
jgi:hypothetical protein